MWRGELVRRLHRRNSPRFFAPPVLVIATGAAVLLVPLAAAGLASSWLAYGMLLAPAAYLVLLAAVAAGSGGSAPDRLRRSGVLAVMHYAWGGGFLVGMARGAGTAVDTSRADAAART